MSEKNFGQLGPNFQKSLIKVIIENKKFAVTIIDVIESKYFDGPYFRYIIENVKEMYAKYGEIPSYNGIAEKIMSENEKNSTTTSIHMDTLKGIQEHTLTDEGWIKDTSMNFCKQQVLKKELKLVEKIIENGDFEEYRKIEKIIQNALQVGATSDDIRDAFENIESALEKDSRLPVPLGITGLDNLLKGGLGVGELGVILAPTGTGKTTILTKIANTAYNQGKNVLQIFFEDNVTNILRKHYTIWTGIAPDDQIERKEEVIELVKQKESESTGKLKLLKMPSDSVTISEIKSKLRKLHTEGFNADVLIIDYIDCISPEKSTFGEEWKGEGSVMRSLEAMTSEFNLVIWTATQGNRESISSEVVTTDQMGGSIKKAQIGHVVVSIAKTLEQKEHNLATITLLKSRIGRDGVIFQNCKFNNEYLDIDTDSQNTLLGFEEQKTQEKANRAAEVFKKAQEKRGTILTNQ